MLSATSSPATCPSQAAQVPSQCPLRASVSPTVGVHTASQPYANAYASTPSIRMASYGQHNVTHGTATCPSCVAQVPSQQCPWRASVSSAAGVHTASQPNANAHASSVAQPTHGQCAVQDQERTWKDRILF
jgi:hypothetical protein